MDEIRKIDSDDLEFAKEVSDALQVKIGRINYLLETIEQSRKALEWGSYESDLFKRVDNLLGNTVISEVSLQNIERTQQSSQTFELEKFDRFLSELNHYYHVTEVYINGLEKLLENKSTSDRTIKTLRKILSEKRGEIGLVKYKLSEFSTFVQEMKTNLLSG